MRSATTKKISVSVGRDEWEHAKLLAERDGISLSLFVTRAMRLLAEEEERREAARSIVATFPRTARATGEEQKALLELWSNPHRSTTRGAVAKRGRAK